MYYAIKVKKGSKWYYFAKYNNQIIAYPSKKRAQEDAKLYKKNYARVVPFPPNTTHHSLK